MSLFKALIEQAAGLLGIQVADVRDPSPDLGGFAYCASLEDAEVLAGALRASGISARAVCWSSPGSRPHVVIG